ncbi:MAG: ketoacyl-ACP synthase III [Verrucomicrobiota bacterium]
MTCTFPENEVSTESLAISLGVNARRVVSMTGIENRRVAPPHICASDLCADAAERLISSLGWKKDTIEALVFVSQTPDYILPATACTLQHRLGLSHECAAFDVNQGCSGYIYGLWLASSLVESGLSRVLLLVGDTSNRCVSEEDKSVAFLFGDSGSATAIERAEATSHFVLGTDGSGARNLIIEAGQCRQRPNPGNCLRVEVEGGKRRPTELFMDGSEVMAFTLREVPPLFEQLLGYAGLQRGQLDAVVMHQANKFLIDNLARKIDMPTDRIPTSFLNFGNTSCASIPVTIATRLRDAVSSNPLTLALMGFGVGWSWSACTLALGPIPVPEITFLK